MTALAWHGVPKLGLRIPAPRPGAPKPGRRVLKPGYRVHRLELEVPRVKLGLPKTGIKVFKPRLGLNRGWGVSPNLGLASESLGWAPQTWACGP